MLNVIAVNQSLQRAEERIRSTRWDLMASRLDLHQAGERMRVLSVQLSILAADLRATISHPSISCACWRCGTEIDCATCSPGQICSECDGHYAKLSGGAR